MPLSHRERTSATGALVLDAVGKDFGDVTAVADVSLDVPAGEFLTLLGPSGCGKTTLLRIIAGLEDIGRGRILIGDRDVSNVPANRRDTSIMFQNYALFPHKTVLENIGFGLKVRGLARVERDRRAREMLDFIRLPDVAHRRPGQLSGGQCQRVALARSLVIQPSVLLLDEPLGALDANLRRHMQLELKRIQRLVGITFVYVTHDQEEALTMSDRIVVMRNGAVEQIGSPVAIYDTPRTSFVARFIGHCNVIEGAVEAVDGHRVTWIAPALGRTEATNSNGVSLAPGGALTVAIRPERMQLSPRPDEAEHQVAMRVEDIMFLGNMHRLVLRSPIGDEINVEVRDAPQLGPGDEVSVGWSTADALVLYP